MEAVWGWEEPIVERNPEVAGSPSTIAPHARWRRTEERGARTESRVRGGPSGQVMCVHSYPLFSPPFILSALVHAIPIPHPHPIPSHPSAVPQR